MLLRLRSGLGSQVAPDRKILVQGGGGTAHVPQRVIAVLQSFEPEVTGALVTIIAVQQMNLAQAGTA